MQDITVGIVAARDPAGNFLPAIPIFKEETPEREQAEAVAASEIGKLFAHRIREYENAERV